MNTFLISSPPTIWFLPFLKPKWAIANTPPHSQEILHVSVEVKQVTGSALDAAYIKNAACTGVAGIRSNSRKYRSCSKTNPWCNHEEKGDRVD